MNNISSFQQQYPLSPLKFWKKWLGIIPRSIVSTFFWVVIFIILTTADNVSTILLAYMGVRAPESVWFYVSVGIIIDILYLAGYAFYIIAYIRTYFYDMSDQFITIKKGVFAPAEIHVLYTKIQDVYVDQDILDRILGLYDVHIASATVTSGIEAHIDGVSATVAQGIRDTLLSKISTPCAGGVAAESSVPPDSSPATPSLPNNYKASSAEFPVHEAWIRMMRLNNLFVAFLITPFILIFTAPLTITGVFALLATRVGVSAVIIAFTAPVALFLILFFGLMWMTKTGNKNFSFEFQDQFLVMRSGIISRTEQRVPYRSIQNVMIQQGILERWYGLSSVMIENAQGAGMRRQIVLYGQPLEKGQQLYEIAQKITVLHSNPQSMGL